MEVITYHRFVKFNTSVVLWYAPMLGLNSTHVNTRSQVLTMWYCVLTHWGRVTHICISKLTIIGSDNGLSPHRRQAIIWTNAGILLIGPLGTNFSEILFKIHAFSFKKIHWKMSSGKWWPFCLGLNVLRCVWTGAMNGKAGTKQCHCLLNVLRYLLWVVESFLHLLHRKRSWVIMQPKTLW